MVFRNIPLHLLFFLFHIEQPRKNMSFVPDGAIGAIFEIIYFIDSTVDDWNQVLPEAHIFLRDCHRFVAMIQPMRSQEGVRQNGFSTATTSRSQVGPYTTTTIATERTQIEDDDDNNNNNRFINNTNIRMAEISRNKNHTSTPLLSSITPSTPTPLSSDSPPNPPPHDQQGHYRYSQQQYYPSPPLPQQQQQYYQQSTNPHYPPQAAPISEIAVHENQEAARLIITEILQSVQQAKIYVEEFLYENSRKRGSWMQAIQWYVTRAFVSGDYREFFRQEAERIRTLLNDLMLNEEIISKSKETKVEDFRDDMSNDSYMFWTKHLGNDMIVDWIQFKDAYTLLYGTLEPMDEHYIKSVLTSNAKENLRITIYGFISFMQKHGFPFEKNVALRKAFDMPVMGEDKRMEIAKMVMDLVQEFASSEMKKNLVDVYTWYAGVDKKDKKAMQERANKWARLVKESRDVKYDKTKETDEHKRANDVDSARRAVSLFYQEYMVMWRIGQVSREMFNDVDFPGKARIKDFINFYSPLDKANFLIVMGRQEKDWENKKPKVYNFLKKMVGEK
ncbi:hypothetical protein BDA99DRAFT_607953 [Phascolomyces articulosus]|uniref:Uncharacterized protein n=1 Tax=Phascolomyces articulosus TaxID=60185 RepID=A0AAD5K5K3_9FUNG|nr:hypothetical protein BDA99DRAFT_607953 [Phascolomyces articulosus]